MSSFISVTVQNLIPALVDRTSASAWLCKHQCQHNKPSETMALVVVNQSNVPCPVMRSSMPKKLGGNGVWSCFVLGLPTHLLQEFNVSTEHTRTVMNI